MSTITAIDRHRQLFVDRRLIESLESVELRLHEPVPGGTAICRDSLWEGPTCGPRSVIRHGGRYLMYYRAMTTDPGDTSGQLCVALSDDGVQWTKPALGLVSWQGQHETNMVADDAGQSLAIIPWYDSRPGVPDDERIKALHSEPVSGEAHTAFRDPKGPKRLVFWVSADGFTFRKMATQPELVSDRNNCFDGGNTLFWSEAEQCYVLYFRWMEGRFGAEHYRTVARTTSPDLLTWSDAVPMTYGDSPREQFYTNNTLPYYRASDVYIAPAARFMEGRRVLTPEQTAAIDLQVLHGHHYDTDCSDTVLLTSRSGSTQYDRTFMGAFIRPGLGYGHWTSRTNYPLTGMYPTGDGHLALWVVRQNVQPSWHVERLLLRVDGFASVHAPWAGGEMITRPFTFTGDSLSLNYRTSAAGHIRIELQSPDGRPLPGYGLDDCTMIIGDEIDRRVSWPDAPSLRTLAGQPIRLRVQLKDADLYSFVWQ